MSVLFHEPLVGNFVLTGRRGRVAVDAEVVVTIALYVCMYLP